MKNLPYFKWYPADAETDAEYLAMSDAELGLYHHALNISWINNGLPTDAAELAKVLHRSPRAMAKSWGRVSRKFPVADDGLLRNPRQEQERSEARTKSERATNSVRTRYERTYERRADVVPRALTRADSASVSGSVVSSERGVGENQNGHATNEFSQVEPWDRWQGMFVGGIEEDAWREFGAAANTPDRLAALMANTPLWMRTKRYGDGFTGAKKFLGSGVWLKPPPAQMLSGPKSATERLLEDLDVGEE